MKRIYAKFIKLLIISIVLISNCNIANSVDVPVLKDTISNINTHFKMYLEANNAESLKDTPLYKDLPSKQTNRFEYQNYLNKELRKIFDVDYTCYINDTACRLPYYKHLNETNSYASNGYNNDEFALVLKNGQIIYFGAKKFGEYTNIDDKTIEKLGGNVYLEIAYLYVDIDGYDGANTWGKDIFGFYLAQDGKIYPFYGKDTAINAYGINWNSSNNYWRTHKDACGTPNELVNDATYHINGNGCAARIIENNWKVDY